MLDYSVSLNMKETVHYTLKAMFTIMLCVINHNSLLALCHFCFLCLLLLSMLLVISSSLHLPVYRIR